MRNTAQTEELMEPTEAGASLFEDEMPKKEAKFNIVVKDEFSPSIIRLPNKALVLRAWRPTDTLWVHLEQKSLNIVLNHLADSGVPADTLAATMRYCKQGYAYDDNEDEPEYPQALCDVLPEPFST